MQIAMNNRDAFLLERLQKYFSGRGIQIDHSVGVVGYRVNRVKDLMEVVIPHFEKYPARPMGGATHLGRGTRGALITQKWSDYQLFKSAFELVKCKKHLTLDGLVKIVSIKA